MGSGLLFFSQLRNMINHNLEVKVEAGGSQPCRPGLAPWPHTLLHGSSQRDTSSSVKQNLSQNWWCASNLLKS